MKFKKVSIFILLLICLTIFVPAAIGQQTQPPGRELKAFKELLANINASFTFPDGFNEVKPVSTEKFPCHYDLKLPDGDFEIRFQVNQLKNEWKNYDASQSDKVNPDSLYSKVAAAEVKNLAGDGKVFARNMPQRVLDQYNADLGRSYFLNLANSAEANPNNYQFALLVVLQKNHLGYFTVLCMGNERGPEFFKNLNKLKDCLKFNN